MSSEAPRLPRLARAEGIYVWDTDGRRYIDATSGPVVVNIGHGNPRVLRAMREQAERATFAYPAYLESEVTTGLHDTLTRLSGPGFEHAFFVSGGSEAIEKALQFARMHALATGQPRRCKLISREPSFHGSTFGALGITADDLSAPLAPMLIAAHKIPAPMPWRCPAHLGLGDYMSECAEALNRAIEEADPETVLAFVMEPVMGLSGGASFATAAYYRRVREICDARGVLLIYDEVMSGAGRTGRFLAAHHWPATPDIVVLAKGLGGGYAPLGAFLAPARLLDPVRAAGGFHQGHTYKANPLACAAGLAVLEEIIAHDLSGNATRMGELLRARLAVLMDEVALIGDVRGLGLLNAIELTADRASKRRLPRSLDPYERIKALGRKHGLLLYARPPAGRRFGDWLMITPPLTATEAQIEDIVARLRAMLLEYQEEIAEMPKA
jgi:adenosylmethionine-8-amino-7-oxononanoate aminotransferase